MKARKGEEKIQLAEIEFVAVNANELDEIN